jgi:hypothetical protein
MKILNKKVCHGRRCNIATTSFAPTLGAMMMMFVVTPSLESIEHKLNSKSIKLTKLHKVPTLEAININKP